MPRISTPPRSLCWIALVAALWLPARLAAFEYADVVVYGDGPAAFTAAIELAESKHDVLLVCPVAHVGGMMVEGLGNQDVSSLSGSGRPIGGLAAEFYLRINRAYNPTATTPRYSFEAKVAQSVIDGWLLEKGVRQLRSARISEAPGAVRKQGARITEVTLEDGRRIAGRVFIDATVEGDLMAFAGVSYAWGREANSRYGETVNGILGAATDKQYTVSVDPYVTPGNPASGVIVGVQNESVGPIGQGDSSVMGFCLRLPLTKNPANKIPITAPVSYTTNDYELYRRYFAAGGMNDWLDGPGSIDASPTTKLYDLCSWHELSGNLYGRNKGYPNGTCAERAAIYEEHRRFTQGLIYYLSTNPSVPSAVRNEWSRWGLCADEFTDNDGWPRRLYVRSARRMVSDYVITEADVRKNATGAVVPNPQVADSIGLSYWPVDLHPARTIIKDGKVFNEGSCYDPSNYRPFGIAYRALVPRRVECNNLLVPAALSSSYVAYGAVRLEWTFMVLGQSAAAAAAMAFDQNIDVQDVPYHQLRSVLLAKAQRLSLPETEFTPAEIIVDNADSTGVVISGAWTESTTFTGQYYGTNYLHNGRTGQGAKSVRFIPNLPTDGIYQVYTRWNSDATRDTNVPYDIVCAGGTNTVFVNQQQNGNTWYSLGTNHFAARTNGNVLLRTTGTTGYVIADAVRFVLVSGTPVTNSLVGVAASQGLAAERGLAPGQFIFSRIGATNSDLVVNLSVTGTATAGADYLALPSNLTIPTGKATLGLALVPLADPLVEGTETVSVSVNPGAGYQLDEYAAGATIRILDLPFDDWRYSQGINAASGPADDANHNGVPNLIEYALGATNESPATAITNIAGTLYYDYGFWRRRNLGGVTLVPCVSSALHHWSPAPVAEEIFDYDSSSDRIYVRYHLMCPANTSSFFVRLMANFD